MSIRERLSGNEAIAYAMRQINPDVMGAFPITPPPPRSPRSIPAISPTGRWTRNLWPWNRSTAPCPPASARRPPVPGAVTATSSAGLAFMWELLHVAASSRPAHHPSPASAGR